MFKLIDKYIGIPVVFVLGIINKLFPKRRYPETYERILIIKTSALGDTVILLPVLKAIRKRYPQAKISMIATARNMDVLKNDPNIDSLLLLDIKKLGNPFYLLGNIFKIRKLKPDLAIDFDQWLRFSALLSYFSGAKRRIGFRTKGQSKHCLFTDSVGHKRDQHEIECFVDLVKPLGAMVEARKPEIFCSPQGLSEAEEKISDLGINADELMIGIHPGCGKKSWRKAWPAGHYIELIKRIKKDFSAQIILTGAKDESDLCRTISENFTEGVHDLADRISFDGLICLIKKFKLLVLANNGVMHLAASMDVPLIALHGPPDPRRWGPLSEKATVIKSDMDCSPCHYLGFEYKCRGNKCMESIAVDRVFQEVKKKLGS